MLLLHLVQLFVSLVTERRRRDNHGLVDRRGRGGGRGQQRSRFVRCLDQQVMVLDDVTPDISNEILLVLL